MIKRLAAGLDAPQTPPSFRGSRLIIGCVAIAIAIACLAAVASDDGVVNAATQQGQTFRSRVDVVQVDVSVLDSNRKPVLGLQASDFSVLEDGKPRPVVGVRFVDDAAAPPVTAGWLQDVPIDVASNDNHDVPGRIVVLIMDDALTPARPAFATDARKIATSIINRLQPTDLAAVIFTAANKNTQDFTRDRSKLIAAVDKFSPGFADYRMGVDTNGLDLDMHFYMSSVGTLTGVSDYLASIPDRRKVVFWLSPGVPLNLGDTAPTSSTPGRSNPSGKAMGAGVDMRDLAERTERVFAQAQRSNVVIYPIDPTGLGGMRVFVDQRIPLNDERVYQYFQGLVKTVAVGRAAAQEGEMANLVDQERVKRVTETTAALQDFLAQAAARTGGRTVMNTNDWEPGLNAAFEESAAYYLVAFEPASGDTDGRQHRLDVRVAREKTEVRARNTVWAPDLNGEKSKKAAPVAAEITALTGAISGVLPATGLPMRVTLVPLAVPGQRLSTVAVVLGVTQPVPASAKDGRVTETTELQISAFTPEGDPRGSQRHSAHVVLRAGAAGDASYEVIGRIDLAPGRYRLRLAASNGTSRKAGSVFADVTVPDYSNARASVSPIVLGVTPAPASAPRELLAKSLPFVPTVERQFAATHKVTALLRVYQSGQSAIQDAKVTIAIRDSRGAVRIEAKRSLPAAQFAAAGQSESLTGQTPPPVPGTLVRPPISGTPARPQVEAEQPDKFANLSLRSADVSYQLPIRDLEAGDYAAQFDVVIGDVSITKQVRFTVK